MNQNYFIFKNALLLVLTVAVTTGCSTKNSKISPNDEAVLRAQFGDYSFDEEITPERIGRAPDEIAPGFTVRLSCLQDNKIAGKFVVDFDGKLKLPYKKKVDTTGMTRADLRSEINRVYRPFFKTSPNIVVDVVERNYWVDVLGLVQKPGRYLVKNSESLDSVIGKAGGLQKDSRSIAQARYVKINQLNETKLVRLTDYYAGDQSLIPTWQGGDTIFFQSERGEIAEDADASERNYIHVLGEVRVPGELPFKDQADFMYYLVKAGGPTTNADLDKVAIFRVEDGQRKRIVYDVDEDSKDIPEIKGGDIILVYRDEKTPFERGIGTGSGIAAIIGTAATVGLLATE